MLAYLPGCKHPHLARPLELKPCRVGQGERDNAVVVVAAGGVVGDGALSGELVLVAL